MTRWRCLCSYDGTAFEGWQSQPSGNTIQDFIEARLRFIFERPVRIHGSGRTDAGVHARGQVFHFDADWPHPPFSLFRALQCNIPKEIRITALGPISSDFHARCSAIGKRYCYTLWRGQASPFNYRYVWNIGKLSPDILRMQTCAHDFLGRHDFAPFGAINKDNIGESTVKTLFKMDIQEDGAAIIFTTEGSGYLYKMVRIIMGCLFRVGLGQLDPEMIRHALKKGHSDNRLRKECAPASGLFLEKVFYPPAFENHLTNC